MAASTPKRYHCKHEGCSKSFSTSGHLARHAKNHTGPNAVAMGSYAIPSPTLGPYHNVQPHFQFHHQQLHQPSAIFVAPSPPQRFVVPSQTFEPRLSLTRQSFPSPPSSMYTSSPVTTHAPSYLPPLYYKESSVEDQRGPIVCSSPDTATTDHL
ncbi:hypothetical protein BCR33DRAFT_719437 [Rhizoclosmatium globosum]|uniref:C2H2-type domain-containing protein n=1 Tax=Rhizoclosmatium globosum TaxID=329046 RepID=A0A1Y2C0P7_9FUNG|nr:hypothetical protein BCR33DRAFT_719437 [Rhizoclosmatium globosum]|eukprot:ORY40447.1 hypothetical protein BCR33DRAFT_719437 [Rhizoclosmatium globosum]